MRTFYLGAHMPHWLGYTDIPLFISHRRLYKRHSFPRAKGRWALDSGGFSELSLYGEWRTTEKEYVEAINRYAQEVGNLDWAAPMDWMCEPHMLEKTGKSIREHQNLTLLNYLRLKAYDVAVPVIPVLQGWKNSDYERHIYMYLGAGVDLTKEPVVGIGSVCRRQNTEQAAQLIYSVASLGIDLHCFGFKLSGIEAVRPVIHSADSIAWSYHARKNPPLYECRHKHDHCTNCLRFATKWYWDLQGRTAKVAV